MAVIDSGTNTAGKANVDATFNLQVNPPGTTSGGVEFGGGPENGPAAFSELDPGAITGARLVASGEVDPDYRQRTALDALLDSETINYAAQNTGKHNFANTTLAATWSAAGFTTNSGLVTTTTTGLRLRTYAYFPLYGAASFFVEQICSFSAAACPTNTLVDFGAFIDSAANPYTPSDGVTFSITSAGFFGSIYSNGTQTQTGVMAFVPVANTKYKFTISITEDVVRFWINDVLYGSLNRPAGQGQPFMSVSVPYAIRHAIAGGAAGAVYQVVLNDYTVSMGGPISASPLDAIGNRMLGSHQGLSGGTMGSLAAYANNSTPAGAAATNTTSAISTGLGGQGQMNAPVAGATDLIVNSYQVPAGTVAIQGRRLVVRGVRLCMSNGVVAVATTPTVFLVTLNWGHTAVSLATAEAATTKAPRREALGFQSWAIGAAVGAPPAEGPIVMTFQSPIYVNPGEFIAVAVKALAGTATGTETFFVTVTYDYGWE